MRFKTYTLGELVSIKYGKNQKKVLSENGTFPIYGTGGLMGYATKALYDKPSVLIGRKGTIEKIRYVNHPFWTVDTLFYTIVNDNIVIPQFLYYAMLQLDLLQYNEGTTIPSLRTETLNRIELRIPNIDNQKRILHYLATIDEKIELNTKINENLEQQAQAIFKSWFVDFEPFGGVMPDDWRIGTILDLSKEIICGKTPSTKKKEYYGDYMPFITIPDMHNCIYATATERYLSELGAKSQIKKTLPKNSICVSCIGTAGLVVLVSTDSQTNQQINSIIPQEGYSSYYIYLLMHTFSEKINRLGQSGSTIVNLNKSQFGLMEALIPTIDTMNDFDNITKPLFEIILANQQENQRLAALRDTLLPKLMNGEIDVAQVQI